MCASYISPDPLEGAVILAGPGMCTGSRVRHHLRHNLWREESTVVFVGCAANGTLARRIIDGANPVHIFGESIPVRARICTINGYSDHADCAELRAWHRQLGTPKRTFLVHSEVDAMLQLAKHLQNTHLEMPELGQSFTL